VVRRDSGRVLQGGWDVNINAEADVGGIAFSFTPVLNALQSYLLLETYPRNRSFQYPGLLC